MSAKRPLTPEEKSIAARLRSIIAANPDLTEEGVASTVGVTQGQVSHWTGGRLPVPARRAAALGIGDPSEISVAYREIAPQKSLAGDWSDIVGVRQAAALGDGAVPDEYAETHKLKFRAESLRRKGLKANKLAVLYGRGESMTPTIKNGDAILFDTSDVQPHDGKIYVIQYDGELLAKRLIELGGKWFIDSDNKADPKWRKPKPVDETKDFKIYGRVRWIGSWED